MQKIRETLQLKHGKQLVCTFSYVISLYETLTLLVFFYLDPLLLNIFDLRFSLYVIVVGGK